MRILAAIALSATVLVSPAFASKSTDTMKACGASWSSMSAADKAKTTYKAYSATCLKNGGPTASATGSMAATSPQQRMKDCAAKWKALPAADKAKTTYKAFSATCLKG